MRTVSVRNVIVPACEVEVGDGVVVDGRTETVVRHELYAKSAQRYAERLLTTGGVFEFDPAHLVSVVRS